MFRLLADENFDNDILRGVLRRRPGLDFVRVQDVGLIGAQDPEILQWAADEGRILYPRRGHHDHVRLPASRGWSTDAWSDRGGYQRIGPAGHRRHPAHRGR